MEKFKRLNTFINSYYNHGIPIFKRNKIQITTCLNTFGFFSLTQYKSYSSIHYYNNETQQVKEEQEV